MNSTKETIVVVEDDPVSRRLFTRFLTRHGYEVVECGDGQEALKVIFPPDEGKSRREPPRCHAVLLDIELPTMDGTEVLRILRKQYSSVVLPVLMITSRDESPTILDCFRWGANDYVTKPADLPVLLARVRTHLELQSTHHALLYAHEALLHEAKVESVSQLARGMAHELRNPLLQIQMAADGLGHLRADDAKQQYFVSCITENVRRADEIVEKILQDSEAMRAKLESGSVNEVVEKVLRTALAEAELYGVQVGARLGEDLPNCLVAREELGQALRNLLSNAIQAASEAGRLVEVATTKQLMGPTRRGVALMAGHRLREGDEVVAIRIVDNGPGIPPDLLSKICEPFFTTRPAGRHVGLGLTVAQRIVEFHGGLLTIANRTGQTGVEATVLLGTEKQFRVGV